MSTNLIYSFERYINNKVRDARRLMKKITAKKFITHQFQTKPFFLCVYEYK